MKIGFIGLGNVGGKLANNLFKNGFDLIVRDLKKSLTEDFESKGVKIAKTPKELTKEVDLIITCLPSPSSCSEVMESEEGVIEGLTKNNPFGCSIFVTSIGNKAPEAFPNETIIPLVFKH